MHLTRALLDPAQIRERPDVARELAWGLLDILGEMTAAERATRALVEDFRRRWAGAAPIRVRVAVRSASRNGVTATRYRRRDALGWRVGSEVALLVGALETAVVAPRGDMWTGMLCQWTASTLGPVQIPVESWSVVQAEPARCLALPVDPRSLPYAELPVRRRSSCECVDCRQLTRWRA